MKKIIPLITPPIIFTIILKLHKKYLKDQNKPKWHTIQGGILKNKKMFIGDKLYWQKDILNGNYDSYFFDYLSKQNLTGKTMLDIGANAGYISLCFAKMVGEHGHIYSFEPNEYALKRFKKNLEKNKDLKKRIKIFNCALSDNDGEEEFIFTPHVENGSQASFLNSSHTFFPKSVYEKKWGFKRTIVKKDTLDNLIKLKKIKEPDFIKIDIEGGEYLALQGAEKILTKIRPILLLEIHSMFNMLNIVQNLNKKHYNIELLKEEDDGRCFIAATPQN